MKQARPINIIIPMAGLGSRFTKEGYRMPKPLINILGRPMISWLVGNLNFQEDDILFVALQADVENSFQVSQLLRTEFPTLHIKTVLIDGPTRGAAETISFVTKSMSPREADRPIVSLDCDTIYYSDVLESFRMLKPGQGCCCFFHDKGTSPIFSYIETEPNTDRITAIVEKVQISQKANTGAYGFSDGTTLSRYLKRILLDVVPLSGEYYTSAVISEMVQDGVHFRAVHVQKFFCVGTPRQLAEFLTIAKKDISIVDKTRLVLFDADCIPGISKLEMVSDKDVIQRLPRHALEVVLGLRGIGIDARLSLKRGFCHTGTAGGIPFADLETRKRAQANQCLFRVDADLAKEVGW